MTPQEYIEANDLKLTAVFVPMSQSRHAGEKHHSLNWRVTISRPNRPQITTDYMQGIGHAPPLPKGLSPRSIAAAEILQGYAETGRGPGTHTAKIRPPELADVLYCLVMDAGADDYLAYEEFALDYGYDEDSRKGFNIYQQCLQTARELRALSLDLDEAREVFQDY